ncbi:MAG: UDP-N-acetylmuramoyl-L-alanine--D-glutamate ligase [Cellvibrionaceae bacterium]|nr:UDP-N-acetylmuramoyl-L-alanine--D-glutamate ligase [Cellvibrionaceae bacterium]
MGELLATNQRSVIFGYGVTGKSVARYLDSCGENFVAIDSREDIALKQHFSQHFPGRRILLGEPDLELIHSARRIILSPGIARNTPFVAAAIDMGVDVVNDIALFLRAAQKPVLGVTGSNGKSTVVTLLAKVLEAAGKRVALGGNIGTPALDLLQQPEVDVYVLELSSFQLECLDKLGLHAACLLNVTPDHMDRYPSLQAYCMSKHRIFRGAKNVIFNGDDALAVPPIIEGVKRSRFSMAGSAAGESPSFCFNRGSGQILYQGKPILETATLKLVGEHNIENAMAVCALAESLDIDLALVAKALADFPGLPHRCQWIAEINGVTFINDSKGTNVGATAAAIKGLRRQYSGLVLIAGGEAKGADFRALGELISQQVKALITIGKHGAALASAVGQGAIPQFNASSMTQAVSIAQQQAQTGEAVLLSPACASFDMFDSYEHRGNAFVEAVGKL